MHPTRVHAVALHGSNRARHPKVLNHCAWHLQVGGAAHNLALARDMQQKLADLQVASRVSLHALNEGVKLKRCCGRSAVVEV